MTDKDVKHKKSMEKQKEKIDSHIEEAAIEKGVVIVLTGNGKGKSSSAFGMVLRAMGYGHKIGVVQFIKGVQLSGEEIFIRDYCLENKSLQSKSPETKASEIFFYQMGTGFTWDTQDRSSDIEAADRTWAQVVPLLQDDSYDLVVLDELTYMIAYKYLDEQMILDAIANRPPNQSVVVTGRGGGSALQELADTVSEVKDIKHAFKSGVKARKGVDY